MTPTRPELMLDLETLGTASNSVILSIGAVRFYPETGERDEPFYRRIIPRSCQDVGLVIDAETVQWWASQSEIARNEAFAEGLHIPRVPLTNALADFTHYFGGGDRAESDAVDGVWGNGAAFDNVILRNAYKAVGMKPPWEFWQDRCYRTLKALFPGVIPDYKMRRSHVAVDDALDQVEYALQLMTVLRTRCKILGDT